MSRLHPFARLLIAGLGLFVTMVAAGLALAALYTGVAMARSPGVPIDKIIGQLTDATETNALILTLLVYPAGLLWLGFCRVKFDKRSFVSLGLRRARLASNLGRGALTGLLSIAVIWAILWLTGAISVAGWSTAAHSPTVVFSLLGWMLAFGCVGFFEEFVFRGYALHNLTNWLGWKGAVFLQAAVFALVHLGNVATASNSARLAALGAMPSIFLIGIFFALSYRKTGSLWFPIGFHAAWNFSLGCLFSLPVSGIKTFQLLDVKANANNWLSGGSFGAEGSFFLLPVLLALIWLILQAPDHPQALLDLELTAPKPAHEPARQIAATTPEVEEIAQADEERENRFRTKFGTSEGFDESMLRELRELQSQREATEAEKRRERTAHDEELKIDLLKPAIVEPLGEAETPELEEPQVAVAAQVVESLDKPVEVVAPVVVEAPKIVEIAPEVVEAKPVVIVEEKAEVEPVKVPVPVKKKSLPKW